MNSPARGPGLLVLLQYIRRVNEARKRFLGRAGTRFANARSMLRTVDPNNDGVFGCGCLDVGGHMWPVVTPASRPSHPQAK